MGGYPASAGYRFQANKTNIKERIEKRLPIPLGGDVDPDHPTYEENMEAEVVYRDRQAVSTQEEFGDYDVIMNYLRGGPGFGDPLETQNRSKMISMKSTFCFAMQKKCTVVSLQKKRVFIPLIYKQQKKNGRQFVKNVWTVVSQQQSGWTAKDRRY